MPIRSSDITTARIARTADKLLDLADAQALVAAAGKSVSPNDLKDLEEALKPKSGEYKVAVDAGTFLRREIRTLKAMQSEVKAQNSEVERRAPSLLAGEKAILTEGKITRSFGGSEVPEKVKQTLNAMLKNGAAAFDVAELDPKIGKDDHDATQWAVSGKWSPYPQEIEAKGVMSFAYTELTPKKIADDMSTERDQQVLTGFKTHNEVDRRTGKTVSWEEPEYETKRMKGTGNIRTRYDEVSHPEVTALAQASDGYAKYASNFAIMADGSFHAVPAMRRTLEQPDLILTNPSLARGQRLLFNGHIEMSGGMVTSVGLSGRLQKAAADGDAKFVNPVKLLEAWGFKMAPNLQVSFEGSGAVKVDPKTDLIVKG